MPGRTIKPSPSGAELMAKMEKRLAAEVSRRKFMSPYHLHVEEAAEYRRRARLLAAISGPLPVPVLGSVRNVAREFSSARPRWLVHLSDRGQIHLASSELLRYRQFRRRCVEKLFVLYADMQEDWWFYQVLAAMCRTAAADAEAGR